MYKTSKHFCAALFLALPLLFSASPLAHAEEGEVVSGVATVQNCGALFVKGQRISLWGIETLDPDQKCWQDENAWNCGHAAVTALRHYAESIHLSCHIKSRQGKTPQAICYRMKKGKKKDIGKHLIKKGWAMDSKGTYTKAQTKAKSHKRGIWSGCFQTAQDWRAGIKRFIGKPDCAQSRKKKNEPK